ncbi:MAG: D-alanyl-D-alanine carboxypeptidase family protein [bacterium]
MSEMGTNLKKAVAAAVLATSMAGCADAGPPKPFTATISGNEGNATSLNLNTVPAETKLSPSQVRPTPTLVPLPERVAINPNICTEKCAFFPLDQTGHSLSKEFAPSLMAIDSTYLTYKKKTVFLEPTTGTQIMLLLDVLRNAGALVTINSGYRSYQDQEKLRSEELAKHLLHNETQAEAENAVAHTVAKPGHSEHQLGTAVDLQFDSTNARRNELIAKVALEYGFVQTMVGNPDMDEEIWHSRYIGKENVPEYKNFISGKLLTVGWYPRTPQGYFQWKYAQESKTVGVQK